MFASLLNSSSSELSSCSSKEEENDESDDDSASKLENVVSKDTFGRFVNIFVRHALNASQVSLQSLGIVKESSSSSLADVSSPRSKL